MAGTVPGTVYILEHPILNSMKWVLILASAHR